MTDVNEITYKNKKTKTIREKMKINLLLKFKSYPCTFEKKKLLTLVILGVQ